VRRRRNVARRAGATNATGDRTGEVQRAMITLLDGTNSLDLMKGDVEQPVNSDFADIDITFVDENDQNFNPLGARGIGGSA
jgi:xanthine dehydrogenase YagR molybdenum-binding subunit